MQTEKNKPVASHTEEQTTVTFTFNREMYGIRYLIENPAPALRVFNNMLIAAFFDELENDLSTHGLFIGDQTAVESLHQGLCDLVDIKLAEACAKIPREKLI